MLRYIIVRLLQGALVLWAAFTISFFVLYLLPGDPAELMAQGGQTELVNVDQGQLDALRAQYGLDKPIGVQYVLALWNALHLDFGNSYQTGAPAVQEVLTYLPNTLVLGGASLIAAIIIGGLVAFGSTFAPFGWLRQAIGSLPPLGVSIPGFWIGLLLIQFFSFRLGWFPAMGANGPQALVLPAIAMAIPTSAFIAQLLSRSLRRTLAEPFVEVVRSKGLTESKLVQKHVVRNAIIPVLTMVGLMVGNLFSGATITETVFSRPGIGKLMVTSVSKQDIPVVQTLIVLAAVIFVVTSLVIDLLYPLIDPRIKVILQKKKPASAAATPNPKAVTV